MNDSPKSFFLVISVCDKQNSELDSAGDGMGIRIERAVVNINTVYSTQKLNLFFILFY